ncbi:MAG: hypothetical protein HGB10_05970 [Coriobacteriia bacterium]|nr:hypothetical protein [Coriobacteriia bacterium]
MTDEFDGDHHDYGGPVPGPKRPLRPRRWFWMVFIGALLVGFGVPVALTYSPQACHSCHEMDEYYESWSVSSHRAAAPTCLSCHARPGITGLVVYELGFWREIAASVSGRPLDSSGSAALDVASCERTGCHSMNRQASNSGNLRINHRLHVSEQRIPCSTCHAGAVHKGVHGREILPGMGVCEECHRDKLADCGYCHVGTAFRATGAAHP